MERNANLEAVYLQKIVQMKFLIAGLGNMDIDYFGTRHNIGFDVVDLIASRQNLKWDSGKYVHKTEMKYKGKTLVLIKPTTYMNLSGKAVKYWMDLEKIPIQNILVVLDDLNIDFGKLRIKTEGSDGGHNGLKDIQFMLGTNKYPRLRVGIGNNFHKGAQVNFVLGKWSEEENKILQELISQAADACLSYCTAGFANTSNKYNSINLNKEQK